VFLCPLVVVWYILTELGSIAENAAAMGAPVPEFLKKILQKTKAAADEAGDKW
jgi:phage-related holin